MKMITIEVGGRQLPLAFDMQAWAEIEEQIVSPIEKLAELLSGKTRIRTVCALTRILAEGGARHTEGAEPVTGEWLMANARPGQLDRMMTACMDAIAAGMKTEVREEGQSDEVDAVLRELNKKKEPGS